MKNKNFIIMVSIFLITLNGLGTIDNKYVVIPINNIGEFYSITYNFDNNFKYLNYHDDPLFINNNSAKDITYDKVLEFINEDQTDKIQYIDDKWNCVNFAQIVHNNAEEKGIRCGLVIIAYKDKKVAHAFNVFNTTDKGIIYIDCTGSRNNSIDKIMDKEIFLNLNESFKGNDLYIFEKFDNIEIINPYFENEDKIIRSIYIYY